MRPQPFRHGLFVVVTLTLAAVHAAHAQGDIRARIREASRTLALVGAPLGRLDGPQRDRVVAFVAGNALFTLSHELGHAVIATFDLPVLGREEDAADSFATLALLHVGTELTPSGSGGRRPGPDAARRAR